MQLAADQADQNAWSLASNTISSWHMVVNPMSGILTLAFDTFKAVGCCTSASRVRTVPFLARRAIDEQ
ncbi:hypothetical protein [Gluconobacter cerinus]|uniref:hypothetical protein n=1 Tax=Gluconobacter cerinus TaxID=38307 RepID=UPI001C05E3D4|nr:hypothetical protein [Gluconobacter cerinus]